MAKQRMKWTRYQPSSYRSHVPGGIYTIHRYRDGGTPPFWSMEFYDLQTEDDDNRVTKIEFKSPREVWEHTLEHAMASCQHHANERLTAILAARESSGQETS